MRETVLGCLQTIPWTIAVVTLAALPAVSQETGKRFELKAGATVTVDALRVTFERVVQDSRCPTGLQCVWEGDASVSVALEKGRAAPQHRTLHTNRRFDQQAEAHGFAIRLEAVEPHPKEGVTIAPEDYRATFVVTKLEQGTRHQSGTLTPQR